MRYILLLLVCLATWASASAQTTATNFACNDCQGNYHDLFSELDSGKVIVLDWVMPCATCVGPSLTAYNVVQSYATSHPGRVKFYVADDFGTSTCSMLNFWCSDNGMPGTTTFSNPIIDMDDYGGIGMPKIVVLGWRSHRIFFNEKNGGGTLAQFIAAVDSALDEPPVGVVEEHSSSFHMFPNPVSNQLNLDFRHSEGSALSVRVLDMQGRVLMEQGNQDLATNGVTMSMDVAELPAGMYLLQVRLKGKILHDRFLKQ